MDIARAAQSLPEVIIANWPGGLGVRLRNAYWSRRLGAMGKGCSIGIGVCIPAPEFVFLGDSVWIDNYVQLLAGPSSPLPNTRKVPNPQFFGNDGDLHIGSNTHIAPFCILQAHAGLSIGKDSGVGAHSSLYSLSNHYKAPGAAIEFDGDYEHVIKYSPLVPGDQQAHVSSPVVMADASGVAVGCVVLPGSTIGRYSWVVSGSVVRGSIPSGVIAGGNLAVVRKQRFGTAIEQ